MRGAGGGGHRVQQHLVRPACTLQRQGTHPCPGHGHSQDGGPRPGPASCVGPHVCSLCFLHSPRRASAPVSSARTERRPLPHTVVHGLRSTAWCEPCQVTQGRAHREARGTYKPASPLYGATGNSVPSGPFTLPWGVGAMELAQEAGEGPVPGLWVPLLFTPASQLPAMLPPTSVQGRGTQRAASGSVSYVALGLSRAAPWLTNLRWLPPSPNKTPSCPAQQENPTRTQARGHLSPLPWHSAGAPC